jgi:hypothetical protein
VTELLEKREAGAQYWRELGVPLPNTMVYAGYFTLADLAGVTREEFLSQRHLGLQSLAVCEALLGHPLPSTGTSPPRAAAAAAEVRRYWRRQGLKEPALTSLVEAGIRNVTTLRTVGLEAVEGLPGVGPGTYGILEGLLTRSLGRAARGLPREPHLKEREETAPRALPARRLRRILALVATAEQSLKSLHASLPVSPQEDAMLAGEADPDFSFRARTTIECVQKDHLEAVSAALQALLDTTEA